MPLPWLIGAAVVGVAVAIISSDEDDTASRRVTTRSDDSEEKKQKVKQEKLNSFIEKQAEALAKKYQLEDTKCLKVKLAAFNDVDEILDVSEYIAVSKKHQELQGRKRASEEKLLELKRALEMITEV